MSRDAAAPATTRRRPSDSTVATAAGIEPGTRAGSVELKFPKLRQGIYFPEFLEPRRTAEKALTAVIQEAYVQASQPARWTIWSRRSG